MNLKNDLPTEKWRLEYRKRCLEEKSNVDIGIIGRSILGRDIDYYRIGNGKYNIIVVAAHHSMEYITSLLLYDFIDFLSENLTRDGCYHDINLHFLLQKFTYWIIPCVNPDGVELHFGFGKESPLFEREVKMNGSEDFKNWQANARGVDLNHNYDYRFFEYKAIERSEGIVAGRTRYSGEYPESEPETKSMANFVRILNPRLVVSFHAQGEEIFYKPHNDIMTRLAKRAADLVGYTVKTPTGFAAYGGLCDYTGEILGIPSLTVEVGHGKNPLEPSILPVITEKVRPMLIKLPMYI